MLTFKAMQIVQVGPVAAKAYSFTDEHGTPRSGTTISSTVTAVSPNGAVAVIRVKGKTAEEVEKKIARLVPGKPAEIEIRAEQKNGVMLLSA